MQQEKITLYGTKRCGDCYWVINFLRDHNIAFDWVDIDQDKVAEQFILDVNHGMRSVPTLLFPDGELLVEPSLFELTQKINT